MFMLENNGKKNEEALITGITGRDGSYLAEFLLNKGYGAWHKRSRLCLIPAYRSHIPGSALK